MNGDKVELNIPPIDILEALDSYPRSSGRSGKSKANDNSHDDDRTELDKWDHAARAWLSSGTIFLLIIIMHVIQIRSDLRRFTSAANLQVSQACRVLEDKSLSLAAALELASSDIGPISFKFVRDLKSKLRSSINFGAQIFVGRIVEVLLVGIKHYYCLFTGIFVVFQSLMDEVLKSVQQLTTDIFLSKTMDLIRDVLKNMMEFYRNPEKMLADLLMQLLEAPVDGILKNIKVPQSPQLVLDICEKIETLDLVEIHVMMQRYLVALVAALVILLILYNSFQYVKALDDGNEFKIGGKEANLEAAAETKIHLEAARSANSPLKGQNTKEFQMGSINNSAMNSGIGKRLCFWIPADSLRRSLAWLSNFLAYRPFWIYLALGLFGLCHYHLSRYIHRKTLELKNDFIDPALDGLSEKFVEGLTTYLLDLEEKWMALFDEAMKPLKEFIKILIERFEPLIAKVLALSQEIRDRIGEVIKYVDIASVKEGVMAILHCFVLKSMDTLAGVGAVIRDELTDNNKQSSFKGGIVGILKKCITAILERLQVTRYLKKFVDIAIHLFLKSLKKRSVNMYIYLLLCLFLLLQGVLMMLIRLLLGYF